MRRRLRLAALLGAAAVLLAACGGQQWRTNNITGLMPDLQFTLTDEHGQTVHADRFHGKVKLLYFGYTHCPDVCPLTLATVGRVLKTLGDKAGQVRVLFVSVDPKRDTPQALATYTEAFGPQFVGLTGSQSALKSLSKRYRVSYSYEKPDARGDYVVNHSSAIFVFDRDGKIRLLMNRGDGRQAMAHDLEQLLD